MISNSIDIKEKFSKMVEMVFVNSKGEFVFPYDNLYHDEDWTSFTSHSDWLILESKMNSLIKLMNSDINTLNLDLETQVWDMI